MIERKDFLRRIQSNIDEYGYHVTLVTGMGSPRFAYTIGCKEILGSELIFASGEFYSKDDINSIIDPIVKELKKGIDWQGVSLKINSLGSFSLSKVDKSWTRLIALGAFDFYKQNEIQALQILPDREHRTLDIPDMSGEFDVTSQPIWQSLVREWDYPVPRDSTAVTNLRVLFGEKATEVVRWELDGWEIFAGSAPDVPKEDMRVVPLGVLLGIDNSLMPAIHLKIEEGIWRDVDDLVWHAWE